MRIGDPARFLRAGDAGEAEEKQERQGQQEQAVHAQRSIAPADYPVPGADCQAGNARETAGVVGVREFAFFDSNASVNALAS
jgi:hypothetical protein